MGIFKDKLYALADDFAFGDDGFKKVDGERVFFSKKIKLLVNDSYEARRLRVTNYRVSFATDMTSQNFKINAIGNIRSKKGFFCRKAFLEIDENKELEFKISKKKFSKLGEAFRKAYKYYGVELVIDRNDIVLDVAVEALNNLPGLISKVARATKIGVKVAKNEKARGVLKDVGGAILSKLGK